MARPDCPSSVYLDSDTLIYAVTEKDGCEPVLAVLRLAEARKLEVVISDLSYVEVRGWGKNDPYPPELDRRCRDALDSTNLVRVEFPGGSPYGHGSMPTCTTWATTTQSILHRLRRPAST